jgi:hypothetical protein
VFRQWSQLAHSNVVELHLTGPIPDRISIWAVKDDPATLEPLHLVGVRLRNQDPVRGILVLNLFHRQYFIQSNLPRQFSILVIVSTAHRAVNVTPALANLALHHAAEGDQ